MSGKGFGTVVLGFSVVCFIAFATLVRRDTGVGATAPAATDALIGAHSPVKGPVSAPVTIVEFLDPECESCRAMHPIVNTVLEEYGDRVRLVIRYMPFHDNSLLAASALEEAREVGKFEEALDVLFENQPIWASHQDPKPELIAPILADLGIQSDRLERDYVIPKHLWKIERDQADGVRLGIQGTPVFFVNGVRLSGLGYGPLKAAIERALLQERETR